MYISIYQCIYPSINLSVLLSITWLAVVDRSKLGQSGDFYQVSTYLSIYLSICLSIYNLAYCGRQIKTGTKWRFLSGIYLSIYILCIYLPICLSMYISIYQCIYPSINLSVLLSITWLAVVDRSKLGQSGDFYQVSTYLSIYLSICLSIYNLAYCGRQIKTGTKWRFLSGIYLSTHLSNKYLYIY